METEMAGEVDRGAAARFAGLPAIASGRVAEPQLVLACLTAVYAIACGFALLPGWLNDGHTAILITAVAASTTTIVLLRMRSLSEGVAHAVVGCAAPVAAGLTLAADGGVDSAAFAYLNLFVTAYAAMFFTRRAVIVHLLWCLLTSSGALTATDPGNRENGYFVVVLALTMTTTGVMLSRLVRKVWFAAVHDPLTGLLNEQGLRAAAAALPTNAVMLVCDIDRFSLVNDVAGRDGGDELLRAVAAAMTRAWPDAAIARISADVFSAWIPLSTSSSDNEARNARLHQVTARLADLHGLYSVHGIAVDMTVTAGIADADGATPAMLLRRAATAMTAAKHDARGCYRWSADMDRAQRDELHLQAQLRGALHRGELVVHYQPQVARHTRRIVGVEALIRWQHPQLGLLHPGAFLPAAERSPLINDITDYVLLHAIDQGSRWRAIGTPVAVSVNVSARTLTDDTLPDRIAALLEKYGLPAHLLTVEVTETAVMAQPDKARALLDTVRALGVRVSIDDFGTGHTSLAMLADLPVDELKLDRRFVAAATSDPKAAAIVASVADLAQRLDLQIVAEGVEDEPTSVLLDTLGYDLQQGYLHARPEPASATSDRLLGYRIAAAA